MQFTHLFTALLALGVVVHPLPHLGPEALPVVPEVVRRLKVQGILEVCQVREQAVEAPHHILHSPERMSNFFGSSHKIKSHRLYSASKILQAG